jgi:hypothetical protein
MTVRRLHRRVSLRGSHDGLHQDRETLCRFGDAVHADRFTDVSPAAPTTRCGVIVRWLGAQGTAAVDGGHDHRPVGRLVAGAQEIRSAGPVALTGLRYPPWQAQRNPDSVDRGVEGVAKYVGHWDGSLREGAYAQRGTTTRERSVAMGGAQVNRRVRTVAVVGTGRTVVGTHRSPPRRRAPRCRRILVRSVECRRRTGGLRHPLVRASALHGVPQPRKAGSHLGSPLRPGRPVLTGGVSRRWGSVACVRADASPNEVPPDQ